MLKHGEINPLNIFGLRRLDHCPPHFQSIVFDCQSSAPKKISDWIYENLSGRFYYADVYVKDSPNDLSSGKLLSMKKMAAFEIHEEASYFALVLPTLNIPYAYDF